jgi:phage pi2 protein 07
MLEKPPWIIELPVQPSIEQQVKILNGEHVYYIAKCIKRERVIKTHWYLFKGLHFNKAHRKDDK